MDGTLCGLFWPGSFSQALLAKVLWMVRCAGSIGQALLARLFWPKYLGWYAAQALWPKSWEKPVLYA